MRPYPGAMEAAKLPIDYDNYLGYLAVRILAEGLKRAGKNPTSASVVDAMEGMRKTDIGGYTLDYSPNNHHGSKLVEISIYGPGGRWLL